MSTRYCACSPCMAPTLENEGDRPALCSECLDTGCDPGGASDCNRTAAVGAPVMAAQTRAHALGDAILELDALPAGLLIQKDHTGWCVTIRGRAIALVSEQHPTLPEAVADVMAKRRRYHGTIA